MHCSVIRLITEQYTICQSATFTFSDEVNSVAAECMRFLYFQLLLLDESRDKDIIYSFF